MVRSFIHGLLIAAILGQGWAQAGMAAPAEPASQADCTGHMAPGADDGCCPDGGMATGACASACTAIFAPTAAAPEVVVSRGRFESIPFQPVRAGPRYIPLNPPPIA